ncbi:MAG: paraquat-inducible protein A [Proteobacteria bacterium]|nr:paraquat-inducible protein A [Pseudomonadota bacterium]NOG60557.1 paraquat-inducible protein A [Pseudomonadota bacterium]
MADSLIGEVIACHECDHLHYYEQIPAGAKANCLHCGNLLYRHVPDSLTRSLALYITALILFVIANTFPFLSLELGGRVVENILFSSGWAMYELGMGELGVLIFLTSILFPLIVIVGMLYLLIPACLGKVPPRMGQVYRLVNALLPWSLIGVFMLGVLIGIVKLQDLANVIFGPALVALALLLVVYTAARASFNPHELWLTTGHTSLDLDNDEAKNNKILNCHTCGFLDLETDDHQHCVRCHSPLHHRINNSVETTWALLLTAIVLLIPANIYPVMTVIRFGQGEPNTILSGVLHLIESGMWGLAMIVFVASIVVPAMKLMILSFLLISVQKKSLWRPRDRTLLYRVTEVVGAWSMVDIFLVGLLSALVSLDALSTIRPGIGAIFFAGAVVITMFAAQSFDSRLIWDNVREKEQ